jgi:hypothetical protein
MRFEFGALPWELLGRRPVMITLTYPREWDRPEVQQEGGSLPRARRPDGLRRQRGGHRSEAGGVG